MRVSVSHMGNIYVTIRAWAHGLGRSDILIVPPPNSQRTLSLGTKYSPEGLCLPFKLTLGNLIEACELGADTLVITGGEGICRLGYYVKTQEKILRDLGYNFEIIQLSLSKQRGLGLLKLMKRLSNNASWFKIISALRFGIAKQIAMDKIERLVQKVRAIELVKGTANRLYAKAIEAIDNAGDYRTLKKARIDYTDQLNHVAKDTEARPPIVGIIGEFYVVLEPFANQNIESELGKLGVEVRRRTFISAWAKFSFFFNYLGLDETSKIHKAALPYLKRDVGGDGWEAVGEKVLHARDYDGLIHLAPFTCMPEIVAQNIMPSTKENIPVLTILCDEQMNRTGMLTRLEAFVDLLKSRRLAGNNTQQKVS
jgi:predicted nucleotide-binding protein (sugar kinase/HSP70/actin superfamily)